MAYDNELAERIRRLTSDRDDVREQRMFGGLAFMVRGNMAFGVHGDDLILRLGAEQGEDALARPHVRPMDLTRRPLKGFVFVSPEGVRTDEALGGWLRWALEFNATLAAK